MVTIVWSLYRIVHKLHCSVFAALNLISTAIEKAGYTGKIDIGMDVAASEFHRYNYNLI